MPRLATRVETHRGKIALVPVYRQGEDVLRDVPAKVGIVQATVLKYTRSKRREDWYWALVGKVAEGLGISKELLHADLKLKAELIDGYVLGPRGPVPVIGSISREAMDDSKHREYVNVAVELIFEHFLPGVRRKDILAEVERMVGPRPD